MKMWILTAIILGILIIGGIAVTALTTQEEQKTTETLECSSCGNSCTATSNCGRETCGAVSGGSCGCGG